MRRCRILVIARWPLGGIRTYMRYVYGALGDDYQVTIVAASTHENEALRQDCQASGVRLVLSEKPDVMSFVRQIYRELANGNYGSIQSHGFISGICAYVANIRFAIPHILTVHGILEDRLLQGLTGKVKMAATSWIIRHVDVLYSVSHDIQAHLFEQIPSLAGASCNKAVILNGIDTSRFDVLHGDKGSLRRQFGLDKDLFLAGFVGRFMQQKGFNYLIDAIELLNAQNSLPDNFKVVAVGSGDYEEHYRSLVVSKGLADRFVFIPFQSDMAGIYRDLDVVVMPSVWEACPLQPMEALVMGIPLIASNCIGLREVVHNTPALVFESGDTHALSECLGRACSESLQERFTAFMPEACNRFDVSHTVDAFRALLERTARPA